MRTTLTLSNQALLRARAPKQLRRPSVPQVRARDTARNPLEVRAWPHTEHISIAALPRVSGRHRNKALAAARRTRAVELRCQGWTYEAIAEELGYASRGTVYTVVHTALAAEQVGETENLRAMETARLNRLEQAVWSRAMEGDVAAISEGRRIVEARIRLLDLIDKAVREQRGCRTLVCSCAPGTGHKAPGGPV